MSTLTGSGDGCILALQLKRIGDLVLTVPALRTLRGARPDARIVLVVQDHAEGIARMIPGIDDVWVYRRRRPNAGIWRRLVATRFSASLDFNGTDRSTFMTFLARARTRAGFLRQGRKWVRGRVFNALDDSRLLKFHTVDFFTRLLRTLGIDEPPAALRLEVPDEEAVRAGELLRAHGIAGRFAVVHAGSLRPEKYWLPERWAEVIDHVAGRLGMPVVLTGGGDAAEREHLTAIASAAHSPVVHLAGSLSLAGSAAVIAKAGLFLGVDTAATHLAASFEVPQVVLFGPTNPHRWRPRHCRTRILLAGQPGPVTVFAERLPRVAMSEITVDQVVRAVDDLMGR